MSVSVAPEPDAEPAHAAPWSVRHAVTSVAALLLAAATLKFHQSLSAPAGFEGSWMDRPAITAGAISWEALLAVWLLTGRLPRGAWSAALLTFGLFAIVALVKVLSGEASCGCFGRIEFDPRLTLGMDLGVLALLLLIGPSVVPVPERGKTVTLRRLNPRACIAVATCAVLAGPAALFVRPQPMTITASGVVGEQGKLVILEPEKWIGQPMPLLPHIRMSDASADLTQGRWKVVFFRHDCDHCRAAMPDYEREARNDLSRRVALLEVAPPTGASLLRPDTACAVGRLDDAYEWFVETPSSLEVTNGVVRRARTGFGEERLRRRRSEVIK